jgi:hypothetical protein
MTNEITLFGSLETEEHRVVLTEGAGLSGKSAGIVGCEAE